MRIKSILCTFIISILFFTFYPIENKIGITNNQGETITTQYTYNPYKTEENPLRGFFPYIGEQYDSFPYSMEYFYVPLKEVMDDFGSYTFDLTLEPNLDEVTSRGHQTIFRVYLDYPDEPTGIPDFLLNGLTTYSYSDYGGGICPDYTNETLISTLEFFITELGRQYDGDVRIGFIELGLLGFWGEWHTYPHEEWFPNEEIQNRILYAYEKAFNKTRIVVRYPTGDSSLLNIGYHDDSFAYETIGTDEWVFYNLLVADGEEEKWKVEPIGGEVYPDIQKDLWDDFPPKDVQNFTMCVEYTHVSWLLNEDQFSAFFANRKIERARAAALKMGYQYYLPQAVAYETNTSLEISVQLTNVGNAPFYYPITLKVGIDDDFSPIVGHIMESPNITLLPGEIETYNLSIPLIQITNASAVMFKLDSPMVIQPIFFANNETKFDGTIDLLPKIIHTEESGYSVFGIMLLLSLAETIIILISKKRKKLN
ncbi:MAG: hypothetical protein JXA54_12755 [Candidatus Heimdallarchaeota archaeon]|nr:hypothetical protein [Candidatus Heimdallarchaeota archaeon]